MYYWILLQEHLKDIDSMELLTLGVLVFTAVQLTIQVRSSRDAIERDEHIAAKVLLAESFRLTALANRMGDAEDVIRRSSAGLIDPAEFKITESLQIADRVARIRALESAVGTSADSFCNEAAALVAALNRAVAKRNAGEATPTNEQISAAVRGIQATVFEAAYVLEDTADCAPSATKVRRLQYRTEPKSKLGKVAKAHFEKQAAQRSRWTKVRDWVRTSKEP
jgi:hypothetical protein